MCFSSYPIIIRLPTCAIANDLENKISTVTFCLYNTNINQYKPVIVTYTIQQYFCECLCDCEQRDDRHNTGNVVSMGTGLKHG